MLPLGPGDGEGVTHGSFGMARQPWESLPTAAGFPLPCCHEASWSIAPRREDRPGVFLSQAGAAGDCTVGFTMVRSAPPRLNPPPTGRGTVKNQIIFGVERRELLNSVT